MRIKLTAAFVTAGVLLVALAGLTSAQSGGDVERGGRLYNDNCAVCHGPDGRGRIGAVLNKEWPGIKVDAFITTTIANGIKGSRMPAWSQANGGPLTNQDIEDVAAYVQALSGGTEPVAPDPTLAPQSIPTLSGVTGDPSAGSVIFANNCAVCHGDQGQGRIGATLAKNWPAIFPDQFIRTTIARGIDGSPMPAWSQANGGPLTEPEIENVTAYILTLAPVSGATPDAQPSGPVGMTTGLIGLLAGLLILVAVGVIYYRRSGGAQS